jgi:hypothetical protein
MSNEDPMRVGDALPTIVSIRSEGGHRVRVRWQEGCEDLVDLGALVRRYAHYAPLRSDPALFASMTLEDNGATVVWGPGLVDMPAEAIRALVDRPAMAADRA